MKTAATLLLCILSISYLHGQDSLRYSVHFDSDLSEISASEETQLKEFLSTLDTSRMEAIRLSGHTDSDASDDYNMRLSSRRVLTVKDFLSQNDISSKIITSKHFGESQPIDDNSINNGKRNNRRVEIKIKMKAEPIIAHVVVPPKKVEQEPEGDTMIVYPKGTILKLSKADYARDPNCVTMTEYLDGESVREAQITTMTTDGQPLISGGMLDIDLCGTNKCVEVYVPARTVCGQTLPFTQWTAESNNAWAEKTGRPIPVIKINDQYYYEMTVCSSGRINCDVRAPQTKCKWFTPKTRVKLKNGYRIRSIQIASDEPLMLENPIRKTKRKAVFIRTCPCMDQFLYVEAVHKNGTVDTIHFKPLNDFDKREAFGKCKTGEIEKKILFFKIQKKTEYRKYFVRKPDFKQSL